MRINNDKWNEWMNVMIHMFVIKAGAENKWVLR